jgi:hypothetical protein
MTVQEHLQQANHNEVLALHLGSAPIAAYDWAITVLFYAVLHFADAYLLHYHQIQARGHTATWDRRTGRQLPGRNDYVRQYLSQVFPTYQFLYAASRRARYEGAFLGSGGEAYYQNLRDNEFARARQFFRRQGW